MDKQTRVETKIKSNTFTKIVTGLAITAVLGGALAIAGLVSITRESRDFNILLESFKNITSINSASVTMDFSVKPVAREDGVPELVFPNATRDFRLDYENSFKYIPADFLVDFSLTSKTDSLGLKTIDKANGSVSATGEVSFGGTHFEMDGEIVKLEDDFYFNIKKAPFLFYFWGADYTAIQNQWVHFEIDDLDYSNRYYFEIYDVADENIAEYHQVFETAFATKFITVQTESPQTDKNGLRRYVVTFDFTQYPAYLRALDALDENKSDSYDGSLYYKTFEDPKNKAALETLAKTQNIELFIDPTNNYVKKIMYTGKFVPPSRFKKFNKKQINVQASVSFDNINQPLALNPPQNSISLDEATSIMTSKAENQILFDRQMSNVKKIRNALRSYKNYTSYGYPETLEELLESRKSIDERGGKATNDFDDAQNGTIVAWDDDYYSWGTGPFLRSVPKNAYSKQAYSYKKAGQNYELHYNVIDKPVPRSYESTYYYQSYPDVIEGSNTADVNNLSLQGAGRVDSDNDGLSDRQERDVYFTDPNSKDTDNDGYYDGEEVKFGFNPLGAGRAEENSIEDDLRAIEERNRLADDHAKTRDAIRFNHVKEMSTILELAEANAPGAKILGCETSHSSSQLCTNAVGELLFPQLRDPANPIAICRPFIFDVCEYSLSKKDGSGTATTNDYQICFYLERDIAIAREGLNSLTSGGLIQSGCK